MIDIHMHTLNSDGDKNVIEILKMCEELKLSYISITDHDNCRAYNDLKEIEIKKYFSGKIIIGVEMTTSFENYIIEILGYGVDIETINEFYCDNYSIEKTTEREYYIFNKLLNICKKIGLKYSDNIKLDVIKRGRAKRIVYNDLLEYKENYNILGNELLENFTNFTRQGLSNPKNKLYLNEDKLYPSITEVVDLIKQNNGLCFLAHLYIYGFDNHIEYLNRIIKKVNLDGVECYHSRFNNEQIFEILKYAKKNKLYISGGSDFHGSSKPEINIGIGKGNLKISEKGIKPWIKKVKLYN